MKTVYGICPACGVQRTMDKECRTCQIRDIAYGLVKTLEKIAVGLVEVEMRTGPDRRQCKYLIEVARDAATSARKGLLK